MDTKKNIKQIMFSTLGVLLLIVTVIGISYAAWSRIFKGAKENSLTTSAVSFSYVESETNNINITDAIPMSDDNGKKLNGNNNIFDFVVSGTYTNKDTNIMYDVYATPYDKTLEDKYVKVYVTDQNDNPVLGYEDSVPTYDTLKDYTDGTSTESDSKILYSSQLSASKTSDSLRLRVWLSEDYNIPEEALTFSFKVNVKARI